MARSRSIAFSILALMILMPIASYGKPIFVTVRNHAISTTAIVRDGQILLPLRTTFETLNSSVSYDAKNRSIVAHNILHTLHLHVGTKSALLDGHTIVMETPPVEIDGRVYVPVAFAATAMGAIIRYDPHSNVLAVNGSLPSSSARNTRVASEPQELTPAPDSTIQTAYPVVSASLGGAIAPAGGVMLTVDGNNVTANAQFDGRRITYMPNALTPGRHTIAFTANTTTGRTISTQWSFISNGVFFPSGVVNNGITLIGPPSASGFGSSGLFLTGDPVNPLGQHIATPVFTPVFTPVVFPRVPF